MKRVVVLLFVSLFISCFLINGVLAISTTMKDVYEPSETIIIEIKGNILGSIPKENVEFKRNNVAVPFDYDLIKIGGRYYLWAIPPENENSYTLIIRSIATTVSGKLQEIDYYQNFSVKGNLTDYNIKPGIVSTNHDFEIIVNLNQDEDKTISVDFPISGETLLKPGQNTLKFDVDNVPETSIIDIHLGKYTIPVYIIVNESNKKARVDELRFSPRIIESRILITDKNRHYPFIITNAGEKEIRDVTLEYDDELFIVGPNTKFNIAAGKNVYLNLSLKNIPKDNIKKSIYAKYGNNSIEMLVDITQTENIEEAETPYLESSYNETSLFYCAELSGAQCSASETCSGNIVSSINGACCVGKCQVSEESSSYAWIGYLLAGIVIVGGLILWLRYKKQKQESNPLTRKISEAEKKMP